MPNSVCYQFVVVGRFTGGRVGVGQHPVLTVGVIGEVRQQRVIVTLQEVSHCAGLRLTERRGTSECPTAWMQHAVSSLW